MDLSKVEESVLREDSVIDQLISKLGIERQVADDLAKNISFSDYLELGDALGNDDLERAAQFVGSEEPLQQEEINSYTQAKTDNVQAQGGIRNDQGQATDGPIDLPNLSLGSEINTSKGPARITDIDKLGSTTTYTTDKKTQLQTADEIKTNTIQNPADAMQELERLKDLAGLGDVDFKDIQSSDLAGEIEETGAGRPGGFHGGPLAAGAIAGTIMSKRDLEKHTHIDQKPGPKPGKKRR